jgi:hypothetical protein
MERAEQTGDFNSWEGLWTRAKSGEVEKMRPYVRARPEVHYRATKTLVKGDEAVLLVQGASNSFVTMTLRRGRAVEDSGPTVERHRARSELDLRVGASRPGRVCARGIAVGPGRTSDGSQPGGSPRMADEGGFRRVVPIYPD